MTYNHAVNRKQATFWYSAADKSVCREWHMQLQKPLLHNSTNTHTHTRLTALFLGIPRKEKNQSGFSWSKRQWVAVASAGPYASLHLAPDRQPHQHPPLCFLQAACPSCRPANSVKALKACTAQQHKHNICSNAPWFPITNAKVNDYLWQLSLLSSRSHEGLNCWINSTILRYRQEIVTKIVRKKCSWRLKLKYTITIRCVTVHQRPLCIRCSIANQPPSFLMAAFQQLSLAQIVSFRK